MHPVQDGQRPVALRHNRDFLLLWSGQAVSSLGTQVAHLAFPLLMLALTRSPALAGLLGMARGLPFVLLSLPAGALVDRWDRRRVMVVSDVGRALALGSIPLALAFEALTVWQLDVVAAVEGTLFTFFSAAEVACLPRVVPPEQLPDAIGRTQATESVAGMVGPALGGFLYGVAGAVPFLADAVSYAVSAVSLLFIKARFQGERAGGRRLWIEIREGLEWLWRQPLLRFLAVLSGGVNLCGYGYILILIVLAQGLGASSAQIGLILGSSGLGSVLGALALGPLRRRCTFGQIQIATAWILALTWPLYLVAQNLVVLGLANALGFLTVPIFFGAQFGYRLTLIPDQLQGRVNSAFRLVMAGGQPVSLALTGALLEGVGAVATVLILFVPQLALAIAATLHPALRLAGRG